MGDIDERAFPLADAKLCTGLSNLIKQAAQAGNLKRGANETTKAINRNQAKLVIIAGDTRPLEIVLHLPVICEEKSVQFIFVPSKADIGRDASSSRNACALAILDDEMRTDYTELVGNVVNQVATLILNSGNAEN